MFESNTLPTIIIGVIVNPLILRAGRNSPPAVNQFFCPYYFASRQSGVKDEGQTESPRALQGISEGQQIR